MALISYYQQKTLEKLKTFEKSEKLSLPIFYAIRVSGIWFYILFSYIIFQFR